MKKKLLTEDIANELEGASLFFSSSATPPPGKETSVQKEIEPAPTIPITTSPTPQEETPIVKKTPASRKHDTVIPRYHDTTTPRYHDTKQPQVYGVAIEVIRKAVKEFGKEAATHRFTPSEKKEIADLIYTYKSRGIKTSENEIARIAINFLIGDFKENGEASVLHRILEALNE